MKTYIFQAADPKDLKAYIDNLILTQPEKKVVIVTQTTKSFYLIVMSA